MAELRPYPFGRLSARLARELDAGGPIFGLARRDFVLGTPGKDLSVTLHGRRAAAPLGPAAGPHTQMAQNIVLSWLGGCRVMELKTVQVLDELRVPRPCIDMRTVGFNVEWSQELRLEQSLEEYVKASMLIDILRGGVLPLAPDFGDTVFDMSVGYDLAGVKSPRVRAFIDGMKDAKAVVDRLRREFPADLARWRDLDYTTRLSGSVTLSTFHGCPPGEIEGIALHVMENLGLACVVKLNPTLLGADETRRLLGEVLGYTDVRIPDEAFAKDARWEEVVGFVGRLNARAKGLGVGFGVKFTNTLVTENPGDFLPPSEKTRYLSGPPLHVLAIQLVHRFRQQFGDTVPVSFSGGIDRHNFPDAVALGLSPVTVCSDLLAPRGYGRLKGYFDDLVARMDKVGAADLPSFILKAHGRFDMGLERAKLLNTAAYAVAVAADPRYRRDRHSAPPRKVDSHLKLFDCLTCDKCLPVCPNGANFTVTLPEAAIPIERLVRADGGWALDVLGSLPVQRKHQIANYADFCNECGNCDVFCPEHGGPYRLKPRFFGSAESWKAEPLLDGFFLEDRETVHGRFDGKEFRLGLRAEGVEYSGAGFRLSFRAADIAGSAEGTADGAVDLTYYHIMDVLLRAVAQDANYVNA